MKPFNLEAAKRGEPVQLRNGSTAIIHTFEGPNSDYPIVISSHDDTTWCVGVRRIDGSILHEGESPFDLVMTTKKQIRYVVTFINAGSLGSCCFDNPQSRAHWIEKYKPMGCIAFATFDQEVEL